LSLFCYVALSIFVALSFCRSFVMSLFYYVALSFCRSFEFFRSFVMSLFRSVALLNESLGHSLDYIPVIWNACPIVFLFVVLCEIDVRSTVLYLELLCINLA